jgi:tetratricopeptide (TPR) repeat protein
MRRTALSFILIIILTTFCTSRRSQYGAVLAGIDRLTEIHPDSARRLLAGLSDEMNDAPAEIQAYYQLLQVKATDKAHGQHTSDSLINAVAAYFKKNPKSGHLPEAYYYVGRVNSELQNGERALIFYQKALLEDSTHVSVHLKSRIYAQIGYIYLRNRLYEEAISMQQLAYFYCKQEGDTLGMRYSSEDIQTITTLAANDSVNDIYKKEHLMKIQKLAEQVKSQVLYEKNTTLQEENSRNKLIVWSSSICLALVLSGVGIILYRRHKRHQHESADATKPSAKKHKFYDAEVNLLLSTHLYNNKVLKTTDWELIEARLLEAFPTFRDQLFSLYQLSETEYHICLLIKLEVSPSNMAKLMATGNSTISQSRLRMQQKVFNGKGTAKDWDNYVLSL